MDYILFLNQKTNKLNKVTEDIRYGAGIEVKVHWWYKLLNGCTSAFFTLIFTALVLISKMVFNKKGLLYFDNYPTCRAWRPDGYWCEPEGLEPCKIPCCKCYSGRAFPSLACAQSLCAAAGFSETTIYLQHIRLARKQCYGTGNLNQLNIFLQGINKN